MVRRLLSVLIVFSTELRLAARALGPSTPTAAVPEEPEAERTEKGAEVEDLPAHPNRFECPISMTVMRYPAIAADGITYEESCVRYWIERNMRPGQAMRSPGPTAVLMDSPFLQSNVGLQIEINHWREDNGLQTVPVRNRAAQPKLRGQPRPVVAAPQRREEEGEEPHRRNLLTTVRGLLRETATVGAVAAVAFGSGVVIGSVSRGSNVAVASGFGGTLQLLAGADREEVAVGDWRDMLRTCAVNFAGAAAFDAGVAVAAGWRSTCQHSPPENCSCTTSRVSQTETVTFCSINGPV